MSADQLILLIAVVLCLLFVGIVVYRKMLRRVGTRGGLVRSDLFGLPDVLVTGTLIALLVLLVAMQWVMPPPLKPPDPSGAASGGREFQIIYNALLFAMPVAVIFVLIISRGITLPVLFGLKRVGFLRGAGIALGLILLLLPVIMMVMLIANWFLGGQSEPQELVQIFQKAAKSGKNEIIWQVVIAAVVIAPITEEILFRGYFYPVLKRFAGALPAALAISLIFGAIHNTASGFPVLTLLALALTLAYEWSGSILVSIFMHAWFNAISLFAMWWAAREGLMQ